MESITRLDVEGAISAKELLIDMYTPNYDFGSKYHLISVSKVEGLITKNDHFSGVLPSVPLAIDVIARGISSGESQTNFAQLISELTPYVTALNEQLQA